MYVFNILAAGLAITTSLANAAAVPQPMTPATETAQPSLVSRTLYCKGWRGKWNPFCWGAGTVKEDCDGTFNFAEPLCIEYNMGLRNNNGTKEEQESDD